MVRVTTTWVVKQGNLPKALSLLNEYRQFAESQNITTFVFSEPWSHHSLRVHIHADHPNAGDAQEWITAFWDNPRAVQALRDLQAVVEPDYLDISMLIEQR